MRDLENKYVPHGRDITIGCRRRGKIPLGRYSLKIIRKKHTLWKRYLMETRDGKYYQEDCRARNKVRTLSRKMQKSFETKLAKDAKQNPKAIWKHINSKCKTREGVSDLRKDMKNPNIPVTALDKEKALWTVLHQCLRGRT